MDIKYARNIEEAWMWLERRYEPIECSFGRMSVVGEWGLDHHNEYSDNPPVSLRAFQLAASGVRIQEFVVTGMPDPDILYAIAALSGKIPLVRDEANAIAELDSSSAISNNRNPFTPRYRKSLIIRRKILPLPFSEDGFKRGVREAIRVFDGGYTEKDEKWAIQQEAERPEKARKAILAKSKNGRVVLVKLNDWVEDVWFNNGVRWVVRFDPVHKVVVVSSSKEDLQNIYSALGPGWGGHDNIGGSPRGQKMTLEDAREVYEKIKSLI